jgi:hypothetical protein
VNTAALEGICKERVMVYCTILQPHFSECLEEKSKLAQPGQIRTRDLPNTKCLTLDHDDRSLLLQLLNHTSLITGQTLTRVPHITLHRTATVGGIRHKQASSCCDIDIDYAFKKMAPQSTHCVQTTQCYPVCKHVKCDKFHTNCNLY